MASSWQMYNLETILARLAWLIDVPEGLLVQYDIGEHDIYIYKLDSQIFLTYSEMTITQQEIMSRIDLLDPLNLLSVYTQVMLLSLIWQTLPSAVYMAGCGGGRMPLVLQHMHPDITIDCTDTTPDIYPIAEKFFGLQFDDKMQLHIEDGRTFLERRTAESRYDIILLDVFGHVDYGPYHFATQEFYQLCKQNLIVGGVVALNLITREERYWEKLTTFYDAFEHVYFYHDDQVNVLLGHDGPALSKADILARSTQLDTQYPFARFFTKHATKLITGKQLEAFLPPISERRILTDNQGDKVKG
ncbi:MAG: fused MFS/spermidine synthase [Chloroflexota bacterium]